MKFINFILLFIPITPITGNGQQIIYSEPEKNISNSRDVEIIGKIEDNFLMCAAIKNKYQLQVYDDQLKLKEKVNLDFIPAETYQVDFVSYPKLFLVIFQSKYNKQVYVSAARLDKSGKLLEKIVTLDSIKAGAYNGRVIYSFAVSENKKHILLYRSLGGVNPEAQLIEQLIVSDELKTEKTDKYFVSYFLDEHFASDLKLDDEGNVVFIRYSKPLNATTNLTFYKAPFSSPDLEMKDMTINKYALAFPQIKINNSKGLYYLSSFYEGSETNVRGLLSVVLNKDLTDHERPLVYAFPDSIKQINSTKKAKIFPDSYSLKDIIFKEDGGFVITGTLIKNNSNIAMPGSGLVTNTPFANELIIPRKIGGRNVVEVIDRRDLYSFNSLNDPLSYSIERGNNSNYNNNLIPTNSISSGGDVVVFSIDKYNHITSLTRLSDNAMLTPLLPYCKVLNSGNKLYFIYNNIDKNNNPLLSYSSFEDGATAIPNTFFVNPNKSFTFLPELGKQVDEHTMIIPCKKNNTTAFGKIHFE